MSNMASIHAREKQKKLFEIIADYTPIRGRKIPLADEVRQAFMEVPRHKFVRQFRLVGESDHITPRSVDDIGALDLIYSNQPLMYVDSAGRTLPASNSEPAFILHLLAMLDLRPGQRVLEIGCGTGWLLSIMARLIGRTGEVIGIEILDTLAEQARNNIQAVDSSNITVICGNGASANFDLGKFDRVIFTASTYEIPDYLFDITKQDGLLLVPLRNRGPAEEAVLLRRIPTGFESQEVRLCKFVPLISNWSMTDPSGVKPLPENGFWSSIIQDRRRKKAFHFSPGDVKTQLYRTLPFTAFLSRTEPQFRVFSLSPSAGMGGLERATFGDPITIALALGREEFRSATLWHQGELWELGENSTATQDFERAFDDWNARGKPTGAEFKLAVSRQDKGQNFLASNNQWHEIRGNHLFTWTIA